MSNVFLKRGQVYSQTEGNFQVLQTLDEGIYQVHQNPDNGALFLVKIANDFHFGFKLYGVDDTLITHVIDTYNKQPVKKNLGVLLNGTKGTGKTVTAKMLCNRLGLPVILCERPYNGLNYFLASINHDCVFLFDEFEKNFRLKCDDDEDCAGEGLLSIMDGVYNSDHCHIFILTTNELKVNDNLISRPSRIRYLKTFGDVMDKDILNEIIDDTLIYKEFKNEIIDFVDSLTMATIDIVKCIVDEVNLHKCSVSKFKPFFNVKESNYMYYTRRWVANKTGDDSVSKKDFLNACKADYGKAEFSPNYGSLVTKKPLKKLNVGDMLNSNSKIIELDLANGYILCNDVTYNYRVIHYYIENVDAAPSLYSGKYDCAYGSDD